MKQIYYCCLVLLAFSLERISAQSEASSFERNRQFQPVIGAWALEHSMKWAHDFVTEYVIPYWKVDYSQQQVNGFIEGIHKFLVRIKQASDDPVACLRQTTMLPVMLDQRLILALKQSVKILKEQLKEIVLSSNPLQFGVTTLNILGVFNDPFEFAGDYGPRMNPIREKIFHLLVSRAAIAANLSDAQAQEKRMSKQELIKLAIDQDKEYGPTLGQVVTPELFELIKKRIKMLKQGNQKTIDLLEQFVDDYKDQKLFYFLRNNPPLLLKLDNQIKDAAREGTVVDMPIISSSVLLSGKDAQALKTRLIDSIFTDTVVGLAEKESKLKEALAKLDKGYLSTYLSKAKGIPDNQELAIFCTPIGQAFFYWMYQALNFDLAFAQDPSLIGQVNAVKSAFSETLGDAKKRASLLKEKLLRANTKVLFTQESDQYVPELLSSNGMFLPLGKQNISDGTFVLLASDFWESDYQIIPFPDYPRSQNGAFSVILATQKDTQQKFLLVSGHGHSVKADDGRLQVTMAVEALQRLSALEQEPVVLIIGMDANTKSVQDVKLFKELLQELGLQTTEIGATTIKQRMVTVQHAKAGKFARDEEDYIIVKKDQSLLKDVRVNFTKLFVDPTIPLPNLDNQSDHYAVSAVVVYPTQKIIGNKQLAIHSVSDILENIDAQATSEKRDAHVAKRPEEYRLQRRLVQETKQAIKGTILDNKSLPTQNTKREWVKAFVETYESPYVLSKLKPQQKKRYIAQIMQAFNTIDFDHLTQQDVTALFAEPNGLYTYLSPALQKELRRRFMPYLHAGQPRVTF